MEDSLATVTSQRTQPRSFLTGVVLHEDTRYVRSTSKKILLCEPRTACVYFIDKTDSGER